MTNLPFHDTEAFYKTFLKNCDEICFAAVGLGIDDIADADWWNYFAGDLSPKEAVATALVDYNDVSFQFLGEIGLGGVL